MQDMRYCSEPWVLKSCLPTGHPKGLGIDFGWSQLRFFACMGREGEAYRGRPAEISGLLRYRFLRCEQTSLLFVLKRKNKERWALGLRIEFLGYS